MSPVVVSPATDFHSRWAVRLLDVLLALAGAAAVAVLVLDYGFDDPPVPSKILHVAGAVIVGIFVLDRVGRLVLARQRKAYLQHNWADFLLIAVAGAALVAGSQLHLEVLSAGALYVLITQGYLLVALCVRLLEMNLRIAGSGLHPGWLLVGSFTLLSLGGSGLLMLPVAVPDDAPTLHYVDALFTATSATCVTGLITRDTARDWTVAGQAIILVLIQLGGLGIMLFGSTLALLAGKALSMRGTENIARMVGSERLGDLRRIVRFVVLFVFLIETAGAILLFPMFADLPGPDGGPNPVARAAWQSVFHSVSSFCNAGFSIFTNNMMEGVGADWPRPLREHWQVMGIMAPLIILGGLGFPVLYECARVLRTVPRRVRVALARSPGTRKHPRLHLTLHSRIVLTTTGALLVLGAAGLLLLETGGPQARQLGQNPIYVDAVTRTSDWAQLSPARRLQAAVFQSVSARTAGFNTIDMAELSDAGKLWMCVLMVIGGSPASTAGGMKTIVFALLLLTVWSLFRRREHVEAFRRSLPQELLRRAVTVATLYLGLVLAVTLLLCVALRGLPFLDILFEACSACGTVGLSTGTTGMLNLPGKLIVIGAMFLGRLGPLTLLLALASRIRRSNYAYPSEGVVIG